MGLLKHFRSKSRLVKRDPVEKFDLLPPKRNYISILDQEALRPILYNIFTFVCPHAVDERYKPIEECIIGNGCMLCDLRDLAHCASVKRGWSGIAMFMLSVTALSTSLIIFLSALANKGLADIAMSESKPSTIANAKKYFPSSANIIVSVANFQMFQANGFIFLSVLSALTRTWLLSFKYYVYPS